MRSWEHHKIRNITKLGIRNKTKPGFMNITRCSPYSGIGGCHPAWGWEALCGSRSFRQCHASKINVFLKGCVKNLLL